MVLGPGKGHTENTIRYVFKGHVELTWIFSLEREHPQELADLFLQDVVFASLTLRPLVLEDLIGFRLLSENEK